MTYVLITLSRGIIDNAVFFEDPESAIQALSNHVRDMDPEHDDAALYDTNGLVANTRHFLDEQDRFSENRTLIREVSKERRRSVYIIANPSHPLGFMVTSPDDPMGYTDPAEIVSDLGTMRKDFGNHLKLFLVQPVSGPVVQNAELVKQNAESEIEDFDMTLVEEYVFKGI